MEVSENTDTLLKMVIYSGFSHFHSMVDLSSLLCKRLPEGTPIAV